MELGKLFAAQKELDERIEEQHPRNAGESRQYQKVVALLVELGELANEIRFFKFWSFKPKSRRENILEEYVDAVHFLLSIGLEMGVGKFEIEPIRKDNLSLQFIGLYNAISLLGICFTPEVYGQAFSAYLGLGEMLGFSWEEIEEFYYAKNTINFVRQEIGY